MFKTQVEQGGDGVPPIYIFFWRYTTLPCWTKVEPFYLSHISCTCLTSDNIHKATLPPPPPFFFHITLGKASMVESLLFQFSIQPYGCLRPQASCSLLFQTSELLNKDKRFSLIDRAGRPPWLWLSFSRTTYSETGLSEKRKGGGGGRQIFKGFEEDLGIKVETSEQNKLASVCVFSSQKFAFSW